MSRLTRKEAIEFLKLDEKQFDNFFKSAAEFEPLPRKGGRGRFYFDKDKLAEWKTGYKSRLFNLSRREYARCLDFGLAMYYRGYVSSDWGTGRLREFGQYVSNWVRGQLGEIALKRFCMQKLGLKIKLDFEMHDKLNCLT